MKASEVFEGQAVNYQAYPGARFERGTVTEVKAGGLMVMVRYGNQETAKATYTRDLEPA